MMFNTSTREDIEVLGGLATCEDYRKVKMVIYDTYGLERRGRDYWLVYYEDFVQCPPNAIPKPVSEIPLRPGANATTTLLRAAEKAAEQEGWTLADAWKRICEERGKSADDNPF